MNDWAPYCQIFAAAENKIFVRYCGMDGIYRWLHATERRWVDEPDQTRIPLFVDFKSAREAANNSPEPPTWQEFLKFSQS